MRCALLGAALLLATLPSLAAEVASEIVVHTALAAGLRHHDAKAVWDWMKAGDELTLVRERDNPHDPNAVRVDWNGRVLGYLPRADNASVARQLDRGNPLRARIARLGKYRNHRLKLEIDVYLRL
jgi:hypothetical protein